MRQMLNFVFLSLLFLGNLTFFSEFSLLKKADGSPNLQEKNFIDDLVPSSSKKDLMVYFITHLANALEKGDSSSLANFFDTIVQKGFYKNFGLFQISASNGQEVYEKYVLKHIKKRFVKALLKSNFQYSMIRTIPLLASGQFGLKKIHVVDLEKFQVSPGVVGKVFLGIQTLGRMQGLKNIYRMASLLGNGLQVSSAVGWVYETAKFVLIIYVGKQAMRTLKKKWNKYKVKTAIVEADNAMLEILRNPASSPEKKKLAIQNVSNSYQNYRNFLIQDLEEKVTTFQKQFQRLGKEIRGFDDTLAKFEEIRKEDPKYYETLVPLVEKIKNNLQKSLESKSEKIMNDFFQEQTKILRKSYEKGYFSRLPYIRKNTLNSWIVRGGKSNDLGDPYMGENSFWADMGRYWRKRMFEKTLKNLPVNRLETYRTEKELFQLVLGTTKDLETQQLLEEQILFIDKMRTLDQKIYEKLSLHPTKSSRGLIHRLKLAK